MTYQQDDIVLALFVFSLLPSRAYLTRPYRVDMLSGTSINADSVSQALGDEVLPNLQVRMADPAVAEGCWTRKIHPLPTSALSAYPATYAGFRPFSNPLPAQVCGLIRIKTTDKSLARSGLIYFPYIPEAHCTAPGRPTSGHLTNMLGVANTLKTAVLADDGTNQAELTPVLFSRKNGTHTPMGTTQLGRYFATQTRRSAGRTTTPQPFGAGPPSV